MGNHFTYDGSTVSGWKNEGFSHKASVQPYLFHGTDSNTSAVQKNIFDIGGNMCEWSAEIYSSSRINRGGSAHRDASVFPASYRAGDGSTYADLGF